MFGFSLREKTEKVIEELFSYQVAYTYRPAFNEIVRQGKSIGQNEYSIAFMYMMVMMNGLVAKDEGFDGLDDGYDPNLNRTEKQQLEVSNFINKHSTTILKNIHLANSPASEIKEMLKLVFINAGLSEDDDFSEKENIDNKNDDILEILMEKMEVFKTLFLLSKQFVSSTKGYEFISDFQCKFIFGLQYLGMTDAIGQSLGADDMIVIAAFSASTSDKGQPDAIFDWDANEAGKMFKKMTEVQHENWAIQIMINGGRSVGEIMSKKEDKDNLPLLKVFDDVDLMKEVSRNISP